MSGLMNYTLKIYWCDFRFYKDARAVIARHEAIRATNCGFFECYSSDCFVPRKDVACFAINNIPPYIG